MSCPAVRVSHCALSSLSFNHDKYMINLTALRLQKLAVPPDESENDGEWVIRCLCKLNMSGKLLEQ